METKRYAQGQCPGIILRSLSVVPLLDGMAVRSIYRKQGVIILS